ncbi:MAG TPA: NgoFVII family restriction endonuclease [Oscillatoriaceae cyanobacterium M33_DOE_052]|uniref:NgoFVII family restriction endonuclease n=1 Tax=Planktothricoides sp. SpSt-374 TaxID=2282167 RepID=A0A7C3VLQ4_9CYAN|nr:NgoFVII family restriction endonuclease [Oscillatoriaceae cyanobacterium M33_DOE_052]
MPRIFDNIELELIEALRHTLPHAYKADFCVGYFHLRGWRQIDDLIEKFVGGELGCCRLLIGMQKSAKEQVQQALSLSKIQNLTSLQAALNLKKQIAREFREQLTWGAPSNADEAGLRRLSQQLKTQKVIVKLFTSYPLHAKLYLLYSQNSYNNPITGFLGSSNLSLAGLQKQGELNIDVLDHDACQKLENWFQDRWEDTFCLDISKELAQVIDESWARPEIIPPYHIYLKIAYHLSREARAGMSEYTIPEELEKQLLDFQSAAVKIAAKKLNRRGGVIVGDVVGLGKTLVATAIARIFEEDYGYSTLIICPKNLVTMWESYVEQYELHAKVLSLSMATKELLNIPARFRLVIIDESHNLRNREGKRYRAIQEFINHSDSKCILLSATPYNKTYLDLSNQLRLFVPEDKDLNMRPEQYLRDIGGEVEFQKRHQAAIRSLAAFEQSKYPDDWRQLMALYMVRRTRSFIIRNYAATDSQGKKYLQFADGSQFYFPNRQPKTVKFSLGIDNNNPYAQLYSETVVDILSQLNLPRYGLGNYIDDEAQKNASPEAQKIITNLSRGGRRLMGFSRTGLFKRLESSGESFIESLRRHILRNYIFLYALENGLDIPIGTQDAGLLDTRSYDEDTDMDSDSDATDPLIDAAGMQLQAKDIYQQYANQYQSRFNWLSAKFFQQKLAEQLREDAEALTQIIQESGDWQAKTDQKLAALVTLVTATHPQEKILIFSQFADTVRYLTIQLQALGIAGVAGVTGDTDDPTTISWRFSPESSNKRHEVPPQDELRILICTDILSEGHNLQDAAIIVNYDLPWAIIRLIQRAGRIDRIGQKADNILCYSFLPAEGVEDIIKLRDRLRQRLRENAEVVGTDEVFFEDEPQDQVILDLYHEKSGVLDDETDGEVDLLSEAYQIWKNAVDADPSLPAKIENLPDVVYATKPHQPDKWKPEGVLLYMRTEEGNDALVWVDAEGNNVSQSQLEILQAAACEPDTPSLPKRENHHELVKIGGELIAQEEKSLGGQLGRKTGARYRTYHRLETYGKKLPDNALAAELKAVIEQIYKYPLRQSAIDSLNRQLRSGISDQSLAELVLNFHQDNRLCLIPEQGDTPQPAQIICSLGLSGG